MSSRSDFYGQLKLVRSGVTILIRKLERGSPWESVARRELKILDAIQALLNTVGYMMYGQFADASQFLAHAVKLVREVQIETQYRSRGVAAERKEEASSAPLPQIPALSPEKAAREIASRIVNAWDDRYLSRGQITEVPGYSLARLEDLICAGILRAVMPRPRASCQFELEVEPKENANVKEPTQ